jgi:hypothetical protein
MIYTAEIAMTKVGEIWKVTNGFENYEGINLHKDI